MKKTLIVAATLTVLFFSKVTAQVNDISLTGAPLAGYTWWDSNSAIEDGVFYGGRLGFGFGKNIELRGLYQKSVDLKSQVSELTNDQDVIDKFNSRDVTVERWGGEFKANIPTSIGLAPYLTLGTGVQTLEVNELKEQQIYADVGLGTKINLSDRIVLNFEAKASGFNLNPSSTLRIAGVSNPTEDWIKDNLTEDTMINWTAMAGLQFYLGGKNHEGYTDLDNAYNRRFSDGLKSFKLIVEPSVAYIDFNEQLNLNDTYLLGVNAGFDFTDFTGIRGYYYNATKDEKLSTDFDKLSVYGADFVARLNVARGVVPYLTIGGGYTNVSEDYTDVNNETTDSEYFAKAGLGLNIPLGKYVELFGAANVMLTTSSESEASAAIESPETLRRNMMYTTGLRFKFGKKENTKATLDSYLNAELDKLKTQKDSKINQLENELKEAYTNNDVNKAVKIIEEKEILEKKYESAVNLERTNLNNKLKQQADENVNQQIQEKSTLAISSQQLQVVNKVQEEPIVVMSPKELQDLVNEVIEGVDNNEYNKKQTQDRLDRLERLLFDVNTIRNNSGRNTKVPQANEALNNQFLEALNKLNAKMDQTSSSVKTFEENQKRFEKKVDNDFFKILKNEDAVKKTTVKKTVDKKGNVTTVKETVTSAPFVKYNHSLAYIGLNFGAATMPVFGTRLHFDIKDYKLDFVPGLMLGMGEDVAYALDADLHYPIEVNKGVIGTPYVGLGLGLNNIIGNIKLSSNIIVGTSFNILGGNLFFDYTSRNMFENNQLSVGYKLSF